MKIESIYWLLNILFVTWAWVAIALTPVAIYFNIKKEKTDDPVLRRRFRKWGIVTLILGPICLFFILPILGLLRYVVMDLMITNY